MRFRQHRGGLAESMATMVTLPDREALVAHVRKHYALFEPFRAEDLTVTLYVDRPDDRIGWPTTYIVMLKGRGPVGFTDGPV